MSQQPNILFIMTDQQRLDAVGYSKLSDFETPNIDKIAQGSGFTNCQTVNPICTPARTAIITGRYSHQIGTLDMSGDLSLQIPTFMHALQKAGYFTAGIGKFHYLQTWEWNRERGKGIPLVEIKNDIKKYGYDEIWEVAGKQLALKNYCDYCQYLEERNLLEEYRDFIESAGNNSNDANENYEWSQPWPFEEKDYVDIVTGDRIIESIRNRPKEKPFFVFGSFCSPHKPYDPPQRYLDKIQYEEKDDFILPEGLEILPENKKKLYRQRRAYKAMIKLIDDQVGRILECLEDENLLENTVIIFTSDHGDMLGDHGRIQKSIYWKQASTVPLCIRHPKYLLNQINHTPVANLDIAATILEIAGLNSTEALSKSWPRFSDIIPSKSLMPIIKNEKSKIREYIFSECKGQWEMIQTEKYKYVIHLDYSELDEAKEEFYDLVNDPEERNNQIRESNYQERIKWCRNKRIYVKDHTPAVQTSWAPLI